MKSAYQVAIEKTKTSLEKHLANIKRNKKWEEYTRMRSIERSKLIEKLDLKIYKDICAKKECPNYGVFSDGTLSCYLNKDDYGSDVITDKSNVPYDCNFFNDMVEKRKMSDFCNEDVDRQNIKLIESIIKAYRK